ncbi:GNAT family N-acetyltransferase [Clostridium sp. UBA6640]|uniref:GNAT family N-acetyltransferase n=1 Tax=Clostridium sp. UBA6640 TaxID=1946370 RepID=UPI0025C64A02|nr:GNAT family N-acetyltransferase [Clostridium sp. UBA6640]
MNLKLKKATQKDAEELFDLQVKTFMPLLEKYQDYETSPANETLEKTISRISYKLGDYYKIIFNNMVAGGIRVMWWEDTTRYKLGPIFITPEFQGKGIAQQAMNMVEELYPQATTWELDTILQEKRNCYLYEKMGYCQGEERKIINDKMTIVFYKKHVLN